MLITIWLFILSLNMPSFGGMVVATVSATDEISCNKLRRIVVNQLGGEKNIKGTVTTCEPMQEP